MVEVKHKKKKPAHARMSTAELKQRMEERVSDARTVHLRKSFDNDNDEN